MPYGVNARGSNWILNTWEDRGLPAGEAHIGEVGHSMVVVQVTPAASALGYAAGDLVGTKLEFTDATRVADGGGEIKTVVIADKDKEDCEFDLVLFGDDPDATTFTDGAALDVADADLAKIVGVINVPSADYTDFTDNSVAVEPDCGVVFELSSGTTTLYGALIARAAATFTSSSDITVGLGIVRS